MKTLVGILLVAVAIVVLTVFRRVGSSRPPRPDIYLGLRTQALQSSRVNLGIPLPSDPAQPWGLLMDWGVTNGTATVLAMSDGTASVYLSSGGGFLGGQGKENVNRAAKRAVAIAGEFQPRMHLTSIFPLPERGHVLFYVLTDSGVFTTQTTEEQLSTGGDPLSKLGNAAQDVVTQFRLLEEKR